MRHGSKLLLSSFREQEVLRPSYSDSGRPVLPGANIENPTRLGSLGVLSVDPQSCQGYNCIYPDGFSKSVDELLGFVIRTDIYADFENINNTNTALVYSLRGMEAATESALEALRPID